MGKAPFKLLFRGSPVLTQEGDNHNQQNSKSSQNTGAGPHPNNVLKPKTNKEFSAWAEYMGRRKMKPSSNGRRTWWAMVKIPRRNEYKGAEALNEQNLHGLYRAGYLAGAPSTSTSTFSMAQWQGGSSQSKDPFLLWHRLALRDTKLPGHPRVHLVFRA
jgi:hypothetical protein